MKKTILFSCIVMAAMVACYKDEAFLNEIPQDPLTKANGYLYGDEHVKMKRHKITPQRAMLIAEEAKTLFADENERQIRSRSVGMTLAPIAITTHSKSRSAGGADTLMYVVNYSNNDGYVFVSNDDRDGEILMYSGGGNFTMQDTAGNEGLKLHVEMMIAYQEHKLKEMKAAEARGEEYMGSMTTETLDMDFAPNDVMPVAMAGGLPGAPGAPGHTCNVTGQAGLPGSTITRKDICAPATYVSKDWEGDVAAIELAEKRYPNQKCFGVPVNPPTVNFMTTGGDHGFSGTPGEAPPCESAPYCTPPLWNYDEYYNFYGAKMSMHLKTVRSEDIQVPPLLKTYWDQYTPLLVNYDKNVAGCGPLAMMQIMAYHNHPATYGSKAFGGVHNTELDKLRTLKTNADIENSPYRQDARKLIAEIGVRLDAKYKNNGNTSIYTTTGTGYIQEVFQSFGYSIGYNGRWDYYRDQNFWRVVASIKDSSPVYILGGYKGGGHIWVLDGYKQLQNCYYYADYYFDEYGKFNAEKKYKTYIPPQEYVHANMGWVGANENVWVERGVYSFDGALYDKELFYIAGIKPNL